MDRALLDHLTALARLELAPEERQAVQQQLERILAHFQQLADLDDLGGTAAESAPAPVATLREDHPQASWPRDQMLAQAPESDGAFYRVPRILEN